MCRFAASSASATGFTVTILQAELKPSHGPLPPLLQPVDLHAHLTRQRLQRFAPQQPQHHVALPAGAPPTPPLAPLPSTQPYFPHLLGYWILP
jgi:hypothetical protein